MGKILIVDDEKEILELLKLYLLNNQHTVTTCTSPLVALEQDLSTYDFAILDIMMPEMDGFQVCRSIREMGFSFPIIMLTARDDDQDKLNGLMIGADDYIVKPFNPLEVVARVNVQLRRMTMNQQSTQEVMYEINGLQVYPKSHRCILYEKNVSLTAIEFAILSLLCENKGIVMSSEQIFESVWKEKFYDSNNTVMVHIQSIRKKLKDTGKQKKFIQTVWGVGYKIENDI